MLVGGLALASRPLLGPPNGAEDTAERLADLAADPNPTMTKVLVFQVAFLLLVPGFIALIGRVRGRGATAVLLGAGAAVLSTPAMYAFVMTMGVEVTLAGDGSVTADTVAAAEALLESPASVPTLVLAMLVYHLLAMPVLALGLVRSRLVPRVVAVGPALGMLMAFFMSGSALESFGWSVLGLSLAALGAWLARPSLFGERRSGEDHVPADLARVG